MEGTTTNTVNPLLKGYSAYNQDVSIFDFADVIVAKNYKEIDRVRLVSGGTSSHIRYVGKGMLTASVQGSELHPVTPSSILRTIRELSLNHVKGIICIVPANCTDILNFGLAVERAVNDDLRVSFIGVADDCKNVELTKSEKRGLSGVVLVNKIAGALAENNARMSYIQEFCKKVVDNISSVGTNVNKMLFTRECLYCKKCAQGITNVSGKTKSILKRISLIDVIGDVVSNLFNDLGTNGNFLNPDVRIVLLINNMGALSHAQEYLFVKECVEFLNQRNIKIVRFYIGSYLHLNYDIDLTLTVLKVFDKELLSLLDLPCSVPGWKTAQQNDPFISFDNVIPGCLRRKCRLSPPIKGPKLTDRASNVLQLCLQFACDALISCERMLNKMDTEKGSDGNVGSKLKTVAEVLNRRICNKKLEMDYPFTFFLSISKLLDNAVGGAMGCIYSIIFEAAANKFGEYKEDDEVTAVIWLEALENACAAVKMYSHAEEGDKTMYDPLQACAASIRKNITERSIITSFGMGVEKAEEIAKTTTRSGRKYPDVGAHAVGIWLRAVYEGVRLRLFE